MSKPQDDQIVPREAPPPIWELQLRDKDEKRYVCAMPPALINDYIVTMRPSDPLQAELHILSFYTPGGWGKGGVAERMKLSGRKGNTLQFSGEEISFQVLGNTGQLKYYGAEFPCMLEQTNVYNDKGVKLYLPADERQ